MRPRPQPKVTTLRRTVDVVTAVSLLLLLAGIGAFQYQQSRLEAAVQTAGDDAVRFQQMIQLRAATKDVPLNERGWPLTIDPAWFAGDPPRNTMVSPNRPWVEVARAEEADLLDPDVRMTIDPERASFWYNPNQGVVRARVPVGISDERALKLYNRVNGTGLSNIYSTREPKVVPQAAATEPPPATTASAPEAPELTPEPAASEPESLDPTIPLPPAAPSLNPALPATDPLRPASGPPF